MVQAKIWGQTIGDLIFEKDKNQVFFRYNDGFRKMGIDISPLLMPINSKEKIFSFHDLSNETFRGLPPVFSDSLPDKFGNLILKNYLETTGLRIEDLTPLEKLSYVGTRGMGALEYFPVLHKTLKEEEIVLSDVVEITKEIMKEKLRLQLDFNSLENILHIGTSAGGAKAKAIIAINNKTNKVFAGDIMFDDKDVTYHLIKIDGVTEGEKLGSSDDYCKIEFAYYELAKLSGIDMMPSRLYEENGRSHFLTQRFDRINGEKTHVQTLNSLAGMNYNSLLMYSYEQCFNVMKKINLSQGEIEQQYRRMVFNVIGKNHDDHTKNISFLMDKSGKWKLSPAYDVTYSNKPGNKWIDQHFLSINGKRKDINYEDLLIVGNKYEIIQANQIIEEVKYGISKWLEKSKTLDISEENRKRIETNLGYNSMKGSTGVSVYLPKSDIQQDRIQIAVNFHIYNKYPSKINNISFDGEKGALNKALSEKFGFKLNKVELEQVHKLVKELNK